MTANAGDVVDEDVWQDRLRPLSVIKWDRAVSFSIFVLLALLPLPRVFARREKESRKEGR
jgi:hypothetical protein